MALLWGHDIGCKTTERNLSRAGKLCRTRICPKCFVMFVEIYMPNANIGSNSVQIQYVLKLLDVWLRFFALHKAGGDECMEI